METNNLYKSGDFPTEGKDEITLYSMKCEYYQHPDSNDPEQDGIQSLEISVENAGAGTYYVIKTDRWALNDLDDLIATLTDFKTRFNYKKEK